MIHMPIAIICFDTTWRSLCSTIASQLSVNIAAVEINSAYFSLPVLRSSPSVTTGGWLDVWFRVVAESDKDAVRLALLLSSLISGGIAGDVLKLVVWRQNVLYWKLFSIGAQNRSHCTSSDAQEVF